MADIQVNISQLKRNLQIESSYTADDALLQHFLDVAELATLRYLGTNSLTGYTGTTGTTAIPITIPQGIILLASHFYLTRNLVSYAQGYSIPYGYEWLLGQDKDIIIA